MKSIPILFGALALLVLSSCGGGGGGGGGGADTGILPPPKLMAEVYHDDTLGADNILLTWDAVKGAVEYRVYMAAEGNVTIAGVLDQTLDEFMYHPGQLVSFPHPDLLNQNKTYYYIMTSIDADGLESAISCEVASSVTDGIGGVSECED